MLATNHVLSGALIGALARRPMLAFGVGVASHFVLDAVPHWGKWESHSRFMRVAVPDGLVSLAAMTAFTALAPADRRAAVAAGMTGALLPDINKPATLWFGRSPFPAAIDRFHHGIQREAPGRAPLELVSAAAFAAAALTALRGCSRISSQQAKWRARRPRRADQSAAAGSMLPADHTRRRVPEGALKGAGGRMAGGRPANLDTRGEPAIRPGPRRLLFRLSGATERGALHEHPSPADQVKQAEQQGQGECAAA